jgi:hypothetical protein
MLIKCDALAFFLTSLPFQHESTRTDALDCSACIALATTAAHIAYRKKIKNAKNYNFHPRSLTLFRQQTRGIQKVFTSETDSLWLMRDDVKLIFASSLSSSTILKLEILVLCMSHVNLINQEDALCCVCRFISGNRCHLTLDVCRIFTIGDYAKIGEVP